MKNGEKNHHDIEKNSPDSKFDPTIAFVQVPVKIKDQVETFIRSLMDDEVDVEKLSSNGPLDPFQAQGCFFVVSLERIEEITGILEKAVNPDENNIEVIRTEIKKALTALQGQ